jgi:uncharacterized sodium:solute symporter family permease YidK
MNVLRRLFLVILVFAVPALITFGLYEGTLYTLAATNRTISPEVLHYSAMGEYAAVFFLMVLDARSRW